MLFDYPALCSQRKVVLKETELQYNHNLSL